jgi:thiamine-monophosphate kinase
MESNKRTELSEIGEFGLIDVIKSRVKKYHDSTLEGIGDDCAVLDTGNELTVVTSDMLIEGVHFDLSYTPLKHLGYKSVAVNISDIAAMNAIPKEITVNVAFSNRFSVEAVEELYQGINAACENYKVDLVGGDTTTSLTGLVISITAIGRVAKEQVVYRKTAQINDLVCVTGDLGGALLGLQTLEREKQEFLANPEMQPQLDDKDYIVHRILKPEARMDVIHQFKDLGLLPKAMIDISDGLASELMHICKSSGVGVRIYEDKLPIDKTTYDTALEFGLDPTTCVLNGGEDYELLFTIDQKDFNKVKNHPDITVIGHIVDQKEGLILITKQENVVPITAQGWKHF